MALKSSLLLPAALFALSASLTGLQQKAHAQGDADRNRPEGLVYVETNNSNAGQNAVVAFRRDDAGKLTELKGSPFSTSGTGFRDLTFSLAPFANDTPVIANSRRSLLFAVNSGSNSVSVFRISRDGTLQPVEGSPFPSGGFQPVSLSLVGDVLTVVNKAEDPAQATAEAAVQPNYTTFRVEESGRLTSTGSTVNATTSPSQALAVRQSRYSQPGFNTERNGDDLGFVFGADFAGGNLQSFEVGRNGLLRQNPVQALPTAPFVGQTFLGGPAPAFPLGLQVHPKQPILYVGFVTINQVGVYTFDAEGRLTFVRSVPNPDPGANCWFITNRAGTRLYAVNTLDNTVTTFDIATDPLTPRGLNVTRLAGGGRAFELALDDDGQFLQVISQVDSPTGSLQDNTLHVLRVDGDTLTEVETVNLTQFVSNAPAGTRWEGAVAF